MPFYYQSHGKKAPNQFVAHVRRIYNPLGFRRGYNFPLWIILGGAVLGFCASRVTYLNYDVVYKKAKWVTGDWEYQRQGVSRIGMLMHLICVIPVGFLIPWQFLPVVRYKAMIFHRLNGYLLMLLLLVGNAGALIVAPRSLGGTLELQTLTGALAIATTLAMLLAYINIKRLQIDQHRAWMLRTWVWAFTVVSMRLIQKAAMIFVSRSGSFYVPMACHSIDIILSLVRPNLAPLFYPECAGDPNRVVAVLANANATPTKEGIPRLHEIGACVQVTFSTCEVLAIFLHAAGVEIYLHLTQGEANRLKRVSRERQAQRGWKRPGDASWLTKETWGDVDPFNYDEGDAAKTDGSSGMEMANHTSLPIFEGTG